MQEYPRLSALERELTYQHWLPSRQNPTGDYSWDGLPDIERLAAFFGCHAKQVRETMRKIEKRFPKPTEATKDAELAEKAPTGDRCKHCRQPIVWIGQTACNPLIMDGVSADQRKSQFRQVHVCPQVWHGGSGVEASVPKE